MFLFPCKSRLLIAIFIPSHPLPPQFPILTRLLRQDSLPSQRRPLYSLQQKVSLPLNLHMTPETTFISRLLPLHMSDPSRAMADAAAFLRSALRTTHPESLQT